MMGEPSTASPRGLRGDMYSRAEERYRAEIATETSQPAPPLTEPPAPEPVQAEPLVVPLAAAATAAVPPPLDFAQGQSAAVAQATEPLVAAPRIVRRSPARRSRRPAKLLIASFGMAATAAALGIAVTLSPAERTAPPAQQTAPTAVHPATLIPTQPFDSAQGKPETDAARPSTATAPEQSRGVSAPIVEAARVETAVATAGRPRASEGRLRITSSPSGARVTVNGIGWGQTPLTVDHLPLGTKTIRLTHDGYAAQQRSVVVSGEEPAQSVTVALRRKSVAGSSR